MGTHYLIDAYTTPIGDSPINDIRFSPPGDASPMNGSFVIRVDDGLDVRPDDVSDLNDLLTSKYTELLAAYPGFTTIIYDDMLDASGVDTTTSKGCSLGDRGTISLAPWGGVSLNPQIKTNVIALGSTPTQAIVTWELFMVSHSDSKNDRATRVYTEVDSNLASFNMLVSFNNGSTWQAVSDGTLFNIAPVDQGNQLIMAPVAISSTGSFRIYVGSWAVIF